MAEVEQGEVEVIDPPVAAGALEVRERGTAIVARDEISVDDLLGQHAKIQEAMTVAMQDGHHYGTIPGVSKPTLLKPGAEKLLVLFRLSPHYASEKIWHDDGHLTVAVVCELRHIPTQLVVSTGEGLCTTRESRYAYRKGERVCPNCGEPQVRKGKPRGSQPANWYCWQKQGGCGTTWELDSEQGRVFEAMETGRVANPDLADTYNTVLKMADKRALVAAVLNGTAASDVFTQDVEDAPVDGNDGGPAPRAEQKPVAWDSIDPGAVVHPDAPKGWTEIDAMLKAVDPGRDWTWVIAGILSGKYGVQKVRDLPDGNVEVGRRLANMAGHLLMVEMGGKEFPPPSNEEVVKVVQWAFDGLTIDLDAEPIAGEVVDDPSSDHVELDLEALQAASADIEFGDAPA